MGEPLAPDVYFPLEIVSREYAGHLLLAVELVARGRTAVIGHKDPVAQAMERAERSGLLFYKNARYPSWADARRHALVGLDPEAGIVYEDFADFFAKRGVIAEDSPSRAQFCFGPDDYEFLVDRFPQQQDRIHLTGAPRVSLWGSAGDRFYGSDVRRITEHYGEVLLFTSSGGFAHEHYLDRKGRDPDATWAATDHAHHFFARARAAAEAFDIAVVVRPHPSDSWTAWQRATADIPNLWVDAAFDLSAWTRAAAAVVHPGTSTAAFEAVCAGIPALSTDSSPKVSNAASEMSHRLPTIDGLLEAITAARSGDLPTMPSASSEELLRRKLLHPLDGATQRIADVLDEATPFDGRSGLRRSISRPSWRWRRRTGDVQALGSSQVRPFKRDPIFLDRVERDVEAALEILGRTTRVGVHPSGPDCFVLSA